MKQKLQFKRPPFKVAPEAPFQHDSLLRKEEIGKLTPIIKTITSPAVMAIDSEWGTGKTAFVQMWAAHLKNENVPSLYFNAWATDFSADPMEPFMGAIEEQLSAQAATPAFKKLHKCAKDLLPAIVGDAMQKSAQAATPAFKKLYKWAKDWLPTIIGDATQKILGKRTADAAEKAAEKFFGHHDKITNFKNALSEFAKDNDAERTVIFVDELDRCRPDYAVKTLERIKHLFEVPGLVFVLAIDKEQLRHTINGLYGAKLDADKYLRRFIDFDYLLKKPNRSAYWNTLIRELGAADFFLKRYGEGSGSWEELSYSFVLLEKIYGFSLRDAEEFMLRVNLSLCALSERDDNNPLAFLAFLTVMRRMAPEELASYTAEGGTANKMVAYWEKKLEEKNVYDDHTVRDMAGRITACLFIAKRTPEHEDIATYYRNYIDRARDINASKGAREYAAAVANTLQSYDNMHEKRYGLFAHFFETIELLGQFKYPDSE